MSTSPNHSQNKTCIRHLVDHFSKKEKKKKKKRQANRQLGPKAHLFRMVPPPPGENQDLRTGIGEEGNREKKDRKRVRKEITFGAVYALLVL